MVITVETVLQIAIGIAISVLSAILLNFIKDWKADKEERLLECQRNKQEIEAMKLALIEILGKSIDNSYSYYIEVGYIPHDKLQQLHRMYEVYTGIGGNGTRTMEIEKLDELPNHPSMIGERK